MSNAFQKITDLKKQLQKTIQEEGGKILQEELKKSLDLMPEIEAIVWAQNHNVYNDESYNFRSSGFMAVPFKDCPWRQEFIEELADACGYDADEEIFSQPNVYDEGIYLLTRLAKKMPLHAERMNFISQTLRDLNKTVPREVLETFDDVAAKATRDGISFEECEYGQ